MRQVDPYTAARFSRPHATLCTCWRLIRPDGEEIGLTDHDREISFTGTVFQAAAGADGSALESTTSLSPDNGDIVGILSSGLLGQDDIDQGRFDGAEIEVWRVDWEDPAARLLLKVGRLGNIERSGGGYTAEFRSAKHQLDHVAGRVYGRTCDAALGDARCGVDLSAPAYRGTATVASAGVREFDVTGIGGFANGWFTHGVMEVLDGPYAGLKRAVRRHEVSGARLVISLWEALPGDLPQGVQLQLTAGCDKAFSTCGTKFANALNFRGFPHIPGNDILTAYPNEDSPKDGGRR